MPSDKKRRGKRRATIAFHGNVYTKKAKTRDVVGLEVNDEVICEGKNVQPQSQCSTTKDDSKSESKSATPPTRSEMKLHDMYAVSKKEYEADNMDSDSEYSCDDEDDDDEQAVTSQALHGYRLIDVDILNSNISSQLSCSFCQGNVSLFEVERKGLGSKFAFMCESRNCDSQQDFPSCPIIQEGNVSVYSVNRHSAFAMRCVGGDRSELVTFCGIMGLPKPVASSSFSHINATIQKAACSVQKQSMEDAATIEHCLAEDATEEVRNIEISVDGTYMTRGHSSNIGVSTAIGVKTGKIIDTGARSKLCKSCEYWQRQDNTSAKYLKWRARHADKCTLTHEGSSGSMEGEIAKEMFARSVEQYNLRYTSFIGDGDTSSFKKVFDSKPYGDVDVQKLECVGHVQKRMGKRLRDVKKNARGKKLSDGKVLGGRGRLTDTEINKIQAYYGNAIRGNTNNLVGMRSAVWAIFFHKLSTDTKPLHHFCLIQWCPNKQRLQAHLLPSSIPTFCQRLSWRRFAPSSKI
ncbi:hypothetical protein V1264_017625 [Littorina saxatilis]|uniref:Mutator-like transposase domain-containing protein n=1 Tax=Littorina saxatilis TaxID=31220 RepID=A0AAN9BN04_9CAEN